VPAPPGKPRRKRKRAGRRKTRSTGRGTLSGAPVPERWNHHPFSGRSRLEPTSDKGRKLTVLQRAQRAWAVRPAELQHLSVPPWYAGIYGSCNWLLRQKCSSPKMTEQRKALALLVRMNYCMDFCHRKLGSEDTRRISFVLPRRNVLFFVRSGFSMWDHTVPDDGGTYPNLWGTGHNTSYALSNNYDWRRALECTLRNFVHLCLPTCVKQVRPLPLRESAAPSAANW